MMHLLLSNNQIVLEEKIVFSCQQQIEEKESCSDLFADNEIVELSLS